MLPFLEAVSLLATWVRSTAQACIRTGEGIRQHLPLAACLARKRRLSRRRKARPPRPPFYPRGRDRHLSYPLRLPLTNQQVALSSKSALPCIYREAHSHRAKKCPTLVRYGKVRPAALQLPPKILHYRLCKSIQVLRLRHFSRIHHALVVVYHRELLNISQHSPSP